MIEKSRRETSGFFFRLARCDIFCPAALRLRGPTVMVNLLKFNGYVGRVSEAPPGRRAYPACTITFSSVSSRPGKRASRSSRRSEIMFSVPEAVARSHRCHAGRASGGSWWTWPPPPRRRALQLSSLPSASVRMISSRSGFPSAERTFSEANLFSFGVIGDHNNPVSAVARPQLITAAGGYYTQTTALLPRAPPQPAQS